MNLFKAPFVRVASLVAALALIAAAGRWSAISGLLATNLLLVWAWLALPTMTAGPRQATH